MLLVLALALLAGSYSDWAARPQSLLVNDQYATTLFLLGLVVFVSAFRTEFRIGHLVHGAVAIIVCLPFSLLLFLALQVAFVVLVFAVVIAAIFGADDIGEGLLEGWAMLATMSALATASWMLVYRRVLSHGEVFTNGPYRYPDYGASLIFVLAGGWLGAHRFYLRRWVSGVLYAASFGFGGLGVCVDLYRLTAGKLFDARGKAVRRPVRPPPLPVRRLPQQPGVGRPEDTRTAVAVLGGVFAVASIVGASWLHESGWPWVFAVPGGMAIGVGGTIGLFVALLIWTREGRRTLIAIGRVSVFAFCFLRRRRLAVDLRHAQHAAGSKGTCTECEGIVVWTDSSEPVAGECFAVFEATASAWRHLVPGAPEPKGPLRVFWFKNEEAANGYLRGSSRERTHFIGYYLRLFGSRIVGNGEWAEAFPSSRRYVLAHEYAHFLHLSARRDLPDPWLTEGIADYCARDVAPPHPALGPRWVRIWRFYEKRGLVLAGREVVGRSDRLEVVVDGNEERLVEHHWRTSLFYSQSLLLTGWLLREHPQKFREMVSARPDKKKSPEARFVMRFGIDPDAAMRAAIASRMADALEPGELTAIPEAGSALDRVYFPRLEDPGKSLSIRLSALSGIHWIAGQEDLPRLRRFIESANGALRREAEKVFESLAEPQR